MSAIRQRWRRLISGREEMFPPAPPDGNGVAGVADNNREMLRANEQECSWPALYYDKIQDLIHLARPDCVVEVGVAYGYHARHILDNNLGVSYVGIDPYMAGYDPKDLFVRDVSKLFSSGEQNSMDKLFDTVREDLALDFGDRAKLLRQDSISASQNFGAESLPFVFIDGDHTYDAVTADLGAWWPKVERGAILAGDDYTWPDVAAAVDEFFGGTVGQRVSVLGSSGNRHLSWFVVKN